MENNKKITTSPVEEAKKKVIDPIKKRLGFYSSIRELYEDILPKITNGTEEEKIVAIERLESMQTSLLRAMESEVHATLLESFDYRLHPWVFELSEKIIEEYDCTTELEKSMASTVASTHIRFMDNSKRLNKLLEEPYDMTTQEATRRLEILSKQTDRAHRQFLNSVAMLKQLKAPQVEVSIKAQTAFVSEKQQINVTNNSHEIIEAK